MDEALVRRIPPHSADAERSVLGAMLMSQEAAVLGSELLTQDVFYDRQNGFVFKAMRELREAG